MNILEWLHDAYTQSEHYANSDLVTAMDAARFRAAANVENIVGKDTYTQLEDFISEAEMASEKYGFMTGFLLAYELVHIN